MNDRAVRRHYSRDADANGRDVEAGFLCTQAVNGVDGAVVAVRGELDMASAPRVGRQLLQLLAFPLNAMTLNLAALSFIDGSGLAVLNTVRINAEDRGVAFTLANVPAQARRVLELSGMASRFRIHEPRADGFGSRAG